MGITLPIALQVPLTVLLQRLEDLSPPPPMVLGLGIFLINIGIGFYAMTRRCTTVERVAIALGYVPAAFFVLFIESYVISVDYLGGDTF